jgi:transcription initiation factor TFIID subunit 9B
MRIEQAPGVSSPSLLAKPTLTTQYLANLAHELNSQPLPPLPESFEVVRLPPPNHRLTEVTFDLVPTNAAALLSDDEMRSDSDSDSESDDDADGEIEEDAEGEKDDDEDDEMEEVGVDIVGMAAPAEPVQEREVDEDYDA